MSNPLNERDTAAFFEKLRAEQPSPDHVSDWERIDKTSQSGRQIYRCKTCEFETSLPNKECLWSKEARERQMKEFRLAYGGCPDVS